MQGHLFYPTGWRQFFEEVSPVRREPGVANPGSGRMPMHRIQLDAAVGLWAVHRAWFEVRSSRPPFQRRREHGQMVLEGRTEIEIEIPIAACGVSIHLDNPVDLRTAGRGR